MICSHPLELLRSDERYRLPSRAELNAKGRSSARPAITLGLLAILGCLLVAPASAQEKPDTAALGDLKSQVQELKEMVLQLQQETVASRAEITRLREELETQHTTTTSAGTASTIDQESPAYWTASTTAQLDQRLDHIDEEQQLLSGKIDEQYQTKLESASKYRVRFSGIVLFNLFGNSGTVDNQDVPTWAALRNPGDSAGSVGGTLRQSILGFEAFGPELWGARTSANVNFDFGGGFPSVYNGVDSGLVRLRTAALRLDWKNTSLIAGQDQLFLSPFSPTSFASVIVPVMSYSGNLWAWTPQLRLEHHFVLAHDSTITLQGALMDNLTGQPPSDYQYVWYRDPSAGEESRQPAYGARVAYSHPLFGQTFTLGAGGYYSRENWGYERNVDGWAGTLDVNLPLSSRFALSAAFYRGAAIGGLGAALGRSVVYDGLLSDPSTEVASLNAVGGWAQLKFRATSKLEFNGAFGQDSPFAADVRYFGGQGLSYAPAYLTGNRAAFGNVIYRPRSDLLFSMEYRRLRTFTIYDNSYEAGQLNMSMGVLF